MFLFQVTESEVQKVARSFKNKLTAGIDGIPDYVVKQCIELLKIPLTNIYNASLESGIFSDKLKIGKVIPVHKKEIQEMFVTTDQLHYYLSFQNY
jgi:hypothetical protein